jgi:hypothetical protein
MSGDLVVLVPDKDIQHALEGVLSRPEALGIRRPDYHVVTHPNHDPGCYHTGDQLLGLYRPEFDHALVVFDRAWGGLPNPDAATLSHDVEAKLHATWGDRGRCVVIDPEVEVWVWSDSPHVADVLGWQGQVPDLRTWLRERGCWPSGQAKPSDPKRALERALRAVKLSPSPALFRRLAERVSFQRCTDPSFRALVSILQGWFPGG